MLQRTTKLLKVSHKPIEPQQGDRILMLSKSETEAALEVRGTRFPGIMVYIGLFFGGILGLIVSAAFFGSNQSGGGFVASAFVALITLPFMGTTLAILFFGLFLWLGSTRLRVTGTEVSYQRMLFGRSFRNQSLPTDGLSVSFGKSHETNGITRYAIVFSHRTGNFKLGGTLKEAELLWLHREVCQSLGIEVPPFKCILEFFLSVTQESIKTTKTIPDYASRRTSFVQSANGCEVRFWKNWWVVFFTCFFGGIFLAIGLMICEPTRDSILGLIPALQKSAEVAGSSGKEPPWWLGPIFALAGSMVMLGGITQAFYRLTITITRTQINLDRSWLFFHSRKEIRSSDLQSIDLKFAGSVNNDPRYEVVGLLKNGKLLKFARFLAPMDAGQLYVRLDQLTETWQTRC